ncbi:recombinase family protein [Cardinium endosymbiont of Nabis limbatus]|uniref:recombinase family protein n=1 Tax=Cardinium endosymbiont of Nabis limbatus TaxID=3066217 RepID=UPI003AF37725
MKTIAYIRVSTSQQDVNNQKLELYEYARKKELTIDDIIETQISSQQDRLKRRIDELLGKLSDGDTIIITEISRLGRSTSEVIHLINEMIKRKIRIMAIKQGLDLNKHSLSSKIIVTIFSLLAELERDLVSLRTKEALQAKKLQGVKLGKPKGTIQKSKFDKDLDRIKELAGLGLSIRKIAAILGYSNHMGLSNYLKKITTVKQ